MFRSFFILLLITNYSYAGFIKIDVTGITDPNAQAAIAALETNLNSQIPNIDQDKYLKGMANASPMSVRGSGVDYASDMSLFGLSYNIIGASVEMKDSSFVDLFSGDIDASNISGAGFNLLTMMFGLNLRVLPFEKLGPFSLNKTRLYLQVSKNSDLTQDAFNGDINIFSLHLQYKVMDPAGVGFGIFKWGGVDFSTGISSQTQNLFVSIKPPSTPIAAGGATAQISQGLQLGIKTSTTTIPFELSTYGRLLYFLKPFIGIGADLNFGKAESLASASTGISISNPSASTTASIDMSGEQTVDAFNLRYFAGLQVDIFILKIYAMMQQSITGDTMGAQVGGRLVW